MQGLAPSVITNQYLKASEIWRSLLDRGNNLAVLFFPYTDRIRRIDQFIEEERQYKEKTYHRVFIQLDPTIIDIEEKNDLLDVLVNNLLTQNVIAKKEPFDVVIKNLASKKTQIVVILLMGDTILQPNYRFFLFALYEILHAYNPFVVSLGCFETDITHPQYTSLFRQYPQFLHSIVYYPLYGRKDTEVFIKYLASKWNYPIQKKEIDHIIDVCGGKWWFIKDAVKQLSITKNWSEDSDDMTYRKNMVIEALLPSERSVLLKLITGRKTYSLEEKHSLEHLMKLNVISENNKLTVPLLRKSLLASINSNHSLTYENNMVYLNQVPIGKFFSRKEIRALKTLVAKPGLLISREDLAKAIWPIDTEANYSNWAIDQIIARVRKRLPEFDISPTSIKSIRGKGYMYIQL